MLRGMLASSGGGNGTPGGTNRQIQFNSGGNFGGFTVSGDATLDTSTGAITVTKTSGNSFGALATITPGTGVATALGNAAGAAGGFALYSSLPSALPPNGSAGGDLSGTYPNPSVAKLGGYSFTISGTVAFGAGGTVVYTAGNQTLTGGFTSTPYNLGSASGWASNAITLSQANGSMQYGVNDHACTINPQSAAGTVVRFDIANASGAGAVTTSGYDKVVGSFDTTTTSKFQCVSDVNQTKVLYITKVA